MTSKILVADDSLTIQKVIRITLANFPYEITECLGEETLWDKLEKGPFDLVLLDFNLSEEKSGYDLAKEIHANYPNYKIMTMLGTFDSVSDQGLTDSGINDKIIKPFESANFIQKCSNLINQIVQDDDEIPNVIKKESPKKQIVSDKKTDDEVGDAWTVRPTSPTKTPPTVDLDLEEEPFDDKIIKDLPEQSPLSLEAEEWEIEVPEIIGESLSQTLDTSLPPVIKLETEESDESKRVSDHEITGSIIIPDEILAKKSTEDAEKESDDTTIPSKEDLEYPTLSEPQTEETTDEVTINESVQDSPDEIDDIEPMFDDESKDSDFWSADSGLDDNENDDSANSINEIVDDESNDENTDESTDSPVTPPKNENIMNNKLEMAIQEINERIKETISIELEKQVKDYCAQTIEKVAWEVIPDLAENLIKKKLSDIANSVENEVIN